MLRVELWTELDRRLSLDFHVVIPCLRMVKPSRNVARHWAAALSGFAISRQGETNHKGCPNNTTIVNVISAKMHQLKNDRHKKTALNDCGELSPCLNELRSPTPLLQCADRLAVTLELVKFILIPPQSSPSAFEYLKLATRLFSRHQV